MIIYSTNKMDEKVNIQVSYRIFKMLDRNKLHKK